MPPYNEVDTDYDAERSMMSRHTLYKSPDTKLLEDAVYELQRALKATGCDYAALEVHQDEVYVVGRIGKYKIDIEDVWKAFY